MQLKSNLVGILLPGTFRIAVHHVNTRCTGSYILMVYIQIMWLCLQLAGEPELNPSFMGAMDGNNSLKWFLQDDLQTDALEFSSNYFISEQYVDQFKDEVKHRVQHPTEVCS